MPTMKVSWLFLLAIVAILQLTLASAGCPYDVRPTGEYKRLEVWPRDKYVGEEWTIRTVEVSYGVESPVSSKVTIRYHEGTSRTTVATTNTDSRGEAHYTPQKAGQYSVTVSSNSAFFTVYPRQGSGEAGPSPECGDGNCNSDESEETCPQDCAYCGDGRCSAGETRDSCGLDCVYCGNHFCDNNEDDDSCPQDCNTCGDGLCSGWETELNCPQDCTNCGNGFCEAGETPQNCQNDCGGKCGDGVCSNGETQSSCSADCKKGGGNGFNLVDYWIYIVPIAIVVIVVIVLKQGIIKIKPRGKGKGKRSRSFGFVKEDEAQRDLGDIEGIIKELLDSGVSEDRIREKLENLGVAKSQIDKMIKDA